MQPHTSIRVALSLNICWLDHRCIRKDWTMLQITVIFLLFSFSNVEGLVDGDLRLNGRGSSPSQGRVEILKNGTWGTVCSRAFGRAEAMVVCRQLGVPQYAVNNSLPILDGRFGAGQGRIFIDDIKCHGYENRLINCMFTYWNNNCGHNDDVGVICADVPITTPSVPPPLWNQQTTRSAQHNQGDSMFHYGICNPQQGRVRLYGPRPGEGVVQVLVDNIWMGISFDICFNIIAARKICSMLCYDPIKSLPGSDPIGYNVLQTTTAISGLNCTGYENNIYACPFTITYSNTYKLAKVTCVDLPTTTGAIPPPALDCSNGRITAIFNSSWPAFVPYSQVTVVTQTAGTCSANRGEHVTYFTMSIPFSECGTKMTWNTTHIMYENSVLYIPAATGIITRIRTYMIYMKCVLPRNYNNTGDVIPLTDSLHVVGKANYTVNMIFYIDNFITKYVNYPVQIIVGNWVHIKLQLGIIDINTKLILRSCWATPSTDMNDPVRYDLFTDLCPADPTVSLYCINNYEFGFRYQTFRFTHYSAVHIHCSAYVCPRDDPSLDCDCNCDMTQPGRRRKRGAGREWVHVRSSYVNMYDPGQHVILEPDVAPTTPSYGGNTRRVGETTRVVTPTTLPPGSLVAVKVVRNKDRTNKKQWNAQQGQHSSNQTGGSAAADEKNQNKVSEVAATETPVTKPTVDLGNAGQEKLAVGIAGNVEQMNVKTPTAPKPHETQTGGKTEVPVNKDGVTTTKPNIGGGQVDEKVVTETIDNDVPTKAHVARVTMVKSVPESSNLSKEDKEFNGTFEQQVLRKTSGVSSNIPSVVLILGVLMYRLMMLID